jgi:hypothetical protein
MKHKPEALHYLYKQIFLFKKTVHPNFQNLDGPHLKTRDLTLPILAAYTTLDY